MVDFLQKWKNGLGKTRKVTFGRVASLLGATQITNDTWDELESILIQSDIGIPTTDKILTAIRRNVVQNGIIRTDDFRNVLHDELVSLLGTPFQLDFNIIPPMIIILIGVNGSGKTTTAAKLGKQFSDAGKKVLLVAADTFRAAATEQLEIWANRLNLPTFSGQSGSDPAAVAYDAVQSATSKRIDVVIIDTAGRLHTRYNLMEELKKVYRVIGKALPGAPHYSFLVMDATTGQNALSQAKTFKEMIPITGVIMAKLDSSAKGGMAFAIQNELNLPILYAGLGEKPEDLQIFDREAFVDAILDY